MEDRVSIEEIKRIIPDRKRDSHKGTYGRVAILGGATEYSGAIRLAALALSALKSGAGLSTIAIPRYLADIVSKNILEQMIYPINCSRIDDKQEIAFEKENIDGLLKRVDVLTIGMGLGKSEGAHKIVEYVIRNYDKKLVLDADALNILSENIDLLKATKANIVLTPHMMEFARLLSRNDLENVEKDKINLAKDFAKKYKVVILFKGQVTIVMNGDVVKFVDRGTPGMSTAGSGDVLSGIITGLLGYIDSAFDAAVAAAYINGMAGELAAKEFGEISMTACDTVNNIYKAMIEIKGK